jgi:choloylglycine hydrolase
MCTAATYKTKDFYMGRTLDYEFSYGEQITITPRNYEFDFRFAGKIKSHYALIGMAFVAEGYPLYYDAVNEKGLGMAGLNFVGNAAYEEALPEDETEVSQVAQFEFIPWILTQCATVAEAREKLAAMRLTGTAFSEQLPTAQLHWIIADKDSCIVVESMKDGLHVYDNPVGVLTNNPPFPGQMFALNNYAGVSRKQPESTFAGVLQLDAYSRGMGGMGIPGDLSSQSRFVKVAFTKLNSISGEEEGESVSQFFHILGSVDQQRGCCEVTEGKYEITIYTSCCNTAKGIYYYTTYDNHQITAVDMHAENLDSDQLICYPLLSKGEVCIGKPTVEEKIIKADATLDGVFDHLNGFIRFLHPVIINTLCYDLSGVVFRKASATLLCGKSLWLILLFTFLSMKRKIKHQLTGAIREK